MALTQPTEDNPNGEASSTSSWNAVLATIFGNEAPLPDGSTNEIRTEVAGVAAGLSQTVRPSFALPQNAAYGNVAPSHVDVNANIQHAYDFLAHHCNGHWTEDQALGIVANLIHESGCNPHGKPGDGGQALGLCQWHADRRAEFERHFHKRFEDSTFDDQLAFIDYEMTEGKEQAAGKMLKKTHDARDSAAVVSTYYERPKDKAGNAAARASTAAGLASTIQKSDTEVPVAANSADQNQSSSTQIAQADPRVPTKANSAAAQLKKIAPQDMPATTVAANERTPNNPPYAVLTAENAKGDKPKPEGDKVALAKPPVAGPSAA